MKMEPSYKRDPREFSALCMRGYSEKMAICNEGDSSQQNQPCWHPDLDFQHPELREINFHL